MKPAPIGHVFAHDAGELLEGRGRASIKTPERSAGFKVLTAPDVPSVLLELGYLSNEKDASALNSQDWRDKTTGPGRRRDRELLCCAGRFGSGGGEPGGARGRDQALRAALRRRGIALGTFEGRSRPFTFGLNLSSRPVRPLSTQRDPRKAPTRAYETSLARRGTFLSTCARTRWGGGKLLSRFSVTQDAIVSIVGCKLASCMP